MSAPPGNQFAKKAKAWENSIKRALARYSGNSVEAGLDKLADKLVRVAIEDGEQWAVLEIGNRLDGKPTTVISGDDELPPVRLAVIDLVRPG